ncbi:MAG: UDP-N-acetylmuramate--L-alanine ligase [Candidatus Omnitrophota bacterium]
MKKIHFIGIGGVGVSALAEISLEGGDKVRGSDIRENSITRRLAKAGATVFIGHCAGNVGDADVVVYSSAVPADNPELAISREKNIPVLSRGEMLAEMMKEKTGIAVGGSHGKTTTTSMIALILEKAGLSPTIAIGANVGHFSGNAKLGGGEYFVAEADESDGSFLYLAPKHCVITNIEKEHMDYYSEMVRVVDAYLEFLNKTSGVSFLCADCPNVRRIAKKTKAKITTYGLWKNADLTARDISLEGLISQYEVLYKGRVLGNVKLAVPGVHNIVNSLAALGVAMECGINFETARDILSQYKGAERRFQVISEKDAITIVDDYGHHPTEVKATVAAAKQSKPERLIGIFQPHRYTRTLNLKEEFAAAFSGVDKLILTDVYAACERPIQGVSADLILQGVKRWGHKDAVYMPKDKIVDYLERIVKQGDFILFMGAGDIGNLAYELAGRAAVGSYNV